MVAKPVNSAMARQIQAGVVMDTQPQAFDAPATRCRYPSSSWRCGRHHLI